MLVHFLSFTKNSTKKVLEFSSITALFRVKTDGESRPKTLVTGSLTTPRSKKSSFGIFLVIYAKFDRYLSKIMSRKH